MQPALCALFAASRAGSDTPDYTRGFNPCGVTFDDIRGATETWLYERRTITCIKEIANIREPVSPVHYGPKVDFDCPHPPKLCYYKLGCGNWCVCPLWRRSKHSDAFVEFESVDALRVYTVAKYGIREDLLYGGLTRMKFPELPAGCLTRACVEGTIGAMTDPYTSLDFREGAWQYNRTWTSLGGHSGASKFVQHEWTHPYNGRMVYVITPRGDLVNSTLYIQLPVDGAALMHRLYI